MGRNLTATGPISIPWTVCSTCVRANLRGTRFEDNQPFLTFTITESRRMTQKAVHIGFEADHHPKSKTTIRPHPIVRDCMNHSLTAGLHVTQTTQVSSAKWFDSPESTRGSRVNSVASSRLWNASCGRSRPSGRTTETAATAGVQGLRQHPWADKACGVRMCYPAGRLHER